MTNEDNALLRVSATKPRVAELIAEYQRCSPYTAGFNRLSENERIRFARWDHQSLDGRKHSTSEKAAEPWEGAADTQVFLSDDVCNENVAICTVAFWRSVVRAIGVEASDMEAGANATKALEWFMGAKLYRELVAEVELSAQYMQTYGACVLAPTWQREVAMSLKRVRFDELLEIAQQAEPGSPLAELPAMILDPDLEEEAVRVVQAVATEIVRTGFADALGAEPSELLDNYQVSTTRCRKFVRGLRNEQLGEIPLPYFCKNQPNIAALKPHEDVFFPPYAADVQKSRVFRKEWVSEYELRRRGALEGWDADWIEQAVLQKGKMSNWAATEGQPGEPAATVFSWADSTLTQHDMIEVLYCYQWQLDEDNIPTLYYTVFHAAITEDPNRAGRELCAIHAPLDYEHKQMPFVVGLRERWNRSLTSSRGMPQVLNSRQIELKAQRDALRDLTSLAVVPPVLVPMGGGLNVKYVFGPAAQNPVLGGRKPEFMEVPNRGAVVAFELWDRVEREVDNAAGRMSEGVPLPRVQVKQQMLVNNFLLMWTAAFQQLFGLVAQFMPKGEFLRVTGAEKPLPNGTEIASQHDFILSFDVRELDLEHILKEFKAISESVLPLDSAGVIDRARLVKVMVRAINPSLAKELIVEKEGASQQMFRKVQNDLLLMSAGNEPEYGMDAEPTAPMQLQFAEQIIAANPKYQQALETDADFNERVKKYTQNLQFNIDQQQNKMVGRVGVK
jgi:hypothetical protein